MIEEEKKQEEKRIEKDQQDNSCFICTEHTLEGEIHVLKACKCVIHVACLRPYFMAEINKNNHSIKCPRSADKT